VSVKSRGTSASHNPSPQPSPKREREVFLQALSQAAPDFPRTTADITRDARNQPITIAPNCITM
jgi:hypothetical protein